MPLIINYLKDKINGLIDRYIFKEINNIYTEFMAKELISIEENEQKKKKKKKPQKKHRKNGKNHAENECSCESPHKCEIKPYIELLTKSLLSNVVKNVVLESSKKKSLAKRKKFKKKPTIKNETIVLNSPSITHNSCNSDELRQSFEKLQSPEETSNSNEKTNEDINIDLKKSQSCDATQFLPLNKSDIGEDFIEVKKKKTNSTNKPLKYQVKFPKNLEKNEKNQSKFNRNFDNKKEKGLNKEKNRLEINGNNSTSSLSSKKKSSIDEKLIKQSKTPQNQASKTQNLSLSDSKQAKTPCFIAENKCLDSDHHFLDSELEKELKNPPKIHLSKSNKQKKEDNSSNTISTKGLDPSEISSPSQKTKNSSSLTAPYLSDELFLDINLVNIEDFKYENFEEPEDAGFVKKFNGDMNDFLNELQENAPHIMNYRSLVFNRLQFIVSHIFSEYQPNLRLYGSCATGLALPMSDMDIGIAGFETFNTYDATEILQILLSKLTYLKWVKTYKPIFTASIPVIKMVRNFKDFLFFLFSF